MRLVIGGLIHNRGEITECYLRHLLALDLTGIEAQWFFVCDGHRDSWQLPRGSEYVSVIDYGPRWTREPRDNDDPRPEYRRLAFLRNIMREKLLAAEADALVSIDSDICAPVDLVQRLVGAQSPWVAALVDNSAVRDKHNDQELIRMAGGERHYRRPCFNILNIPEGMTERVNPDWSEGGYSDATGAICLYSRPLLERVAWSWYSCGEDIGFSLAANAEGYRARYLPILCDHLMTQERLALHKECCELCR